MAASEAPTNTSNNSSAPSSTTTANNIGHNFHELCRSCGKTNAELYDLFQTTNLPFSTSSTTCYTHLNNCSSISSTLSSTTSTITNKPSTLITTLPAAAGSTKSSSYLSALTFDSVAATAKATAKGQSNMDNILQEMQIWQLLIKCNDGLPQRICAKCTAQFYMIHKFRRKCLKVQTQLRTLYEEQQKCNERQQQQSQPQPQPQHQHQPQNQHQKEENNVTVKDATIVLATSTPIGSAVAVAVAKPESDLPLADAVVKPPPVMHKLNDLVNDNYGEQQQHQQQQQPQTSAVIDNIVNIKSSVSFEANTGNTNDFIAPSTTVKTTTSAALLLDNCETMLQKTEANEPTPTTSAPPPGFIDKTFEARLHAHCTVTLEPKLLKDEKIPLLKPAILDAKRSPPLTLQPPLEQICDNDTTTGQMNANKKLCLDQEDLLETHVIFKSNTNTNNDKQNDLEAFRRNDNTKLFDMEATHDTRPNALSSSSSSSPSCAVAVTATNENYFKLNLNEPELDLQLTDCAFGKANSESLFVTKAALKAYTISSPYHTSENAENRDDQKPITNSEAIELKNANDNNNNAHGNNYSFHRYDNRIEPSSSTSNSLPSPPSTTLNFNFSIKQMQQQQQQQQQQLQQQQQHLEQQTLQRRRSRRRRRRRCRNICRHKIIKYANHNRRPGHCYKSNPKTVLNTTKMARTIQSYGSEEITIKNNKPRTKQNKYKTLKRLSDDTETSTTASSRSAQKKCQQKKSKMCRKKLLQQQRDIQQIGDELSSTTVSDTLPASSPSSSTSSSSSSSARVAISSTSSLLRATTPAAVTDLVRNCAGQTSSYCRNANKNITKSGNSSADRLSSSSQYFIMWKTKAAMKANGNDMTAELDVDVADDNDDDDDDDDHGNITGISSPYKAPTNPATGSSASSSLSTSSSSSALCSSTATATTTATVTETVTDKSSATLFENQSIKNSGSLKSNNDNHTLMEKYCGYNNAVISLSGNQVKDTKGESELLANIEIFKHNLWPEKADQTTKQIVTNNQPVKEQNTKITIVDKNTTQPIPVNNSSGQDEKTKLPPDMEKNEQQNQTTIPTPPVNGGGMKLIIQRKRGARFKCRRKDDDEASSAYNCHEATQSKRKKKSLQTGKLKEQNKSFSALDASSLHQENEERHPSNKDTMNEFDNLNEDSKVTEFHRAEDENKENPISMNMNNYDFDSDSNVSVYRDPLLIKNEMLEEDTHLTDFSKAQLSIQTECSKEMYKLYKEKVNLESPKKLIVRVPLTSLTQDFKRLHLTMEDQEHEIKNETNTEEEASSDSHLPETNEQAACPEIVNDQENLPLLQQSDLQTYSGSSSQSELLGFSQNGESSPSSVNSSQPSIEMPRYVEPPLCSASTKITDFINDFQNNCIDSSEIEETSDMLPALAPAITQELSDEIRDVEDTLNGIISEMHDRDMYTPRSGETDEFFAHSVYSPLTDCPTTPSQSNYAESTCTINSNPLSVSPFIHHNMDYNAMTPQSNHSSSMGMGSSSYMSAGGSSGPHAVLYSEHYNNYNECFEENTQSELIGFQNDIPCFENIEKANPTNANELQEDINEENEADNTTASVLNNNPEETESSENGDYGELSDYNETSEQFVDTQPTQPVLVDMLPTVPVPPPGIQPHQFPYNPANYQTLHNTPTMQMHNATNPLIPNATATRPHYFVTTTNQGPIIFANSSHLNQGREQIEPHRNNLQFVTLGQAMAANRTQTNPLMNPNRTTEINWPTSVNAAPNFNQRPVIPAPNGTTTTYFINTNGGLYQANIPAANLQNPPVNTIFVPPNAPQATFNKSNIDNADNYMHATIQQRQQVPHHSNGPSSQYIMLVNNLNGSPQYYATTQANLNPTLTPQNNISTSTVLFQPTPAAQQSLQNNTNYHKNPTPENNTEATLKSNFIPITPALGTRENSVSGQTIIHDVINPDSQKDIKHRSLQNLQPRSTNVTQKITLVCRFCQKRPKFKNNVDYSNHIINTHPAENPYNCTHCAMHFSRRSERQQHVAQIHGSRYKCAQCGLSFCAQRTLDFHLQKYHANLGRPHQQQQPNSSSTTAPATYQLLQHNQQQRLVRVEDVHVQITGENKNKRSIDLAMDVTDAGDADVSGVDIKTSQPLNQVDILSHTMEAQQTQQQQQLQHQPQQQQQQQQQQQANRKLCCPDCNGDNNDCCGSNQNHDQEANTTELANISQQNAGNENVNNHPQQQQQQHSQHVTIPSPEQTEPDSTTTLRHFRKRQCEISPNFASVSPSSSSSSSSSSSPALHNNAGNNHGGNDNNVILGYNSPDNILAGDGSVEQIAVERALRGTHNCLLCEESFTNEISLRKHHHLVHGAAVQSTTCNSATTTATATATTTEATSLPLVCTICKRGFRMRNALQRHMETHDAEGRPYECNICQLRFPRPSQLTLHKLTVHKFEKPSSCEECGKQFGTESAMKAHAAEHHEGVASAVTVVTASEAASTLSRQSQTSSRFYFDTMTTTPTNEQFINLQTTAVGEESTASTSTSNNNDDVCNNTTQNTIASGLIT